MKASRKNIALIVSKRLGSRSQVNTKKLSTQVAAYLLSEGRTNELESLLRDISQNRIDEGIIEADVVSAFSLSSSLKKSIENLLDGIFPDSNKTILTNEIDPSLIGGVRIELPNQRLDLSIRAKLNRFKQLTTTSDRKGF